MKVGDLVKQDGVGKVTQNIGVIVSVEMIQKFNGGPKQPYYKVMIGKDFVCFWQHHLEVINESW